MSSPAVGKDGTIYIGSAGGSLYAVNSIGRETWAFPTGGEVYSSAAIGKDGTIYFGSNDGNLYAVSSGSRDSPRLHGLCSVIIRGAWRGRCTSPRSRKYLFRVFPQPWPGGGKLTVTDTAENQGNAASTSSLTNYILAAAGEPAILLGQKKLNSDRSRRYRDADRILSHRGEHLARFILDSGLTADHTSCVPLPHKLTDRPPPTSPKAPYRPPPRL